MADARTPSRRFHVASALRGSSARIDADDARDLLDRGAVLVDVRRKDDPLVTLEEAERIPPDEIPAHLDRLRDAAPVVLACG